MLGKLAMRNSSLDKFAAAVKNAIAAAGGSAVPITAAKLKRAYDNKASVEYAARQLASGKSTRRAAKKKTARRKKPATHK